MLLKDYIKWLQQLPEDLPCVYATDPEGNGYYELEATPSVFELSQLENGEYLFVGENVKKVVVIN